MGSLRPTGELARAVAALTALAFVATLLPGPRFANAQEPSGASAPLPVAPVVLPPAPSDDLVTFRYADPSARTAKALPMDTAVTRRASVVVRAAMLAEAGMPVDPAAFVSAAWGIEPHTADQLWSVAAPIARADLLPGDALNLESWRAPAGRGTVRLFSAWANPARTVLWAYEGARLRVVAYDLRYRPMRLEGLDGTGEAPLGQATAAQIAAALAEIAPKPKPVVAAKHEPDRKAKEAERAKKKAERQAEEARKKEERAAKKAEERAKKLAEHERRKAEKLAKRQAEKERRLQERREREEHHENEDD